ncbi:E3 ubiquitin-protein ligase Topors isoform X1 [Aphis gossypii]|uniref:E3 ubiquitin-protein ligase Topors isoform X1 n=1 Tax=Aphis gossypii TaxID=80765 RepID=UPI00100F59D4|nr:E3 ubiquitin-protein ligase Topors isoform X1 [Aphis gossypii]
MSLIIKSESDVVELSSDEESITLPRNRLPNPRDRSSSPDTQCSICLDGLTNKCYTNSCWHLFCFECLKRWSTSEPTCPLCKKRFESIFHSFDDQGDHQIYDVPPRYITDPVIPRLMVRPMTDLTDASHINSIFRVNFYMDIVRRNVRGNDMGLLANLYDRNNLENGRFYDANLDTTYSSQLMGQAARIQVYIENAWAQPLPDLSGRFRDCSSDFFRNNPAQVHRLQPFILRDIIAIRESARIEGEPMDMSDNNVCIVTHLIMRSLTAYEIREGFMVNILRPFLHWRASHFCHELYNFANSPYDIVGYDRNVQFSLRTRTSPPPDQLPELNENASNFLSEYVPSSEILLENPNRVIGETIVLDSDNEEPQLPILEVIVVSSSGDDSDVEILSHSFRPIESLDSASIDQPSTSTGIRDSLDRPNNRYNLRRRRLQSVQSRYPFRARRRPIVDSSSSDEESIITTRSSETDRMKSRDINNKKKIKSKKKKIKKKKVNNDSRSEFRSINRNRSYSESSSSGDTDVRPNNNFIHADISDIVL